MGVNLENKRIFLEKHLNFWNELTAQEKDFCADNTNAISYKKGQMIKSGEEECLGVLIVKSGEVRTYLLSEYGKEVTLFRISSGEICVLSASCLLKNITFDVIIEANKDTDAFIINSIAFLSLMKSNKAVELYLLRLTVSKYSETMWAMEQILFLSFNTRLEVFLLDESSKTGSNSLKITHEEIAKCIGSAREVVTRMLTSFSNDKLISIKRGSIEILDKHSIQDIASPSNKFR